MNEYLSGEHGPKFVGYAEPSAWQRWRWPLSYGLSIGALAFAIMFLTGRL